MAKKHRILIIDDSEPTIAGLEAYLGGKYHILTALKAEMVFGYLKKMKSESISS